MIDDLILKKEKYDKVLEAKKNLQDRTKGKFPPKEISDYVYKKTEDTYNINAGNLDKESFLLGMIAMWYYIDSEIKSLKNQIANLELRLGER